MGARWPRAETVQGGEARTADREESWGSQPLQLLLLWQGRGFRKQSWHQELTPKAPAETVDLILVPRHHPSWLLGPHHSPTSISCHDLLSGDLADQLEGAKPSGCKTFFVSSHLDGSKPLAHRAKS